MRVLVACERSGVVRRAFRSLGHDAWSCDLEPADDKSPFHIKGDALKAIANCGPWNLLIAHPPCTHLALSGARYWKQKQEAGLQQPAIDFVLKISAAPVNRICIENPVGILGKVWRSADQIIQPFYFGDEAQKTTCLWLKNLPPLMYVREDDMFARKTVVGRGEFYQKKNGGRLAKWSHITSGRSKDRAVIASKTFSGIANAMAEQWGSL